MNSIDPFMHQFTLELKMTYAKSAGNHCEAIEVSQDDDMVAIINGKKCKVLPYQPGAASYVTSIDAEGNELGVLSGNFSGCIMGKVGKRVYHIATTHKGDSMPDCKSLWNRIKSKQAPSTKIVEFKPSDFVGIPNPGNFPKEFPSLAIQQVIRESLKEMVFGLITANNEAFAIRAKGELSGGSITFTTMKIIPVQGAW